MGGPVLKTVARFTAAAVAAPVAAPRGQQAGAAEPIDLGASCGALAGAGRALVGAPDPGPAWGQSSFPAVSVSGVGTAVLLSMGFMSRNDISGALAIATFAEMAINIAIAILSIAILATFAMAITLFALAILAVVASVAILALVATELTAAFRRGAASFCLLRRGRPRLGRRGGVGGAPAEHPRGRRELSQAAAVPALAAARAGQHGRASRRHGAGRDHNRR